MPTKCIETLEIKAPETITTVARISTSPPPPRRQKTSTGRYIQVAR